MHNRCCCEHSIKSRDESVSKGFKSWEMVVYKPGKLCYNRHGLTGIPSGSIQLNRNIFQCPTDAVRGVKGNQVQILSDPVTVSGEIRRKNPLCHRHEKERQASTIRKSGNLLKDAAHSFRRKRPARFHLTQFQFILKRPLFGRKAGAFVMYRLSACCPAGPADPAKPSACLILCMDCRRAALRGPPTRPSLRLAESCAWIVGQAFGLPNHRSPPS